MTGLSGLDPMTDAGGVPRSRAPRAVQPFVWPLCGICPVWVVHQLAANTVDQDTSGFLADSRTLSQMEASGSSSPGASLQSGRPSGHPRSDRL